MARGHTIWVVHDIETGKPVKAFTVKHELRTWWNRQSDAYKLKLWLWAVPDGAYSGRSVRFIPPSEL